VTECEKLKDISGLANMLNLKELRVEDTQVSDLTPIASCKKITYINLLRTQVTDITPLNGFENLEGIDMTKNIPQDQVSKLKTIYPRARVYIE